MNRPDLDALERTCGDCCETVAEVVAYARHLERQLADEVEYINTQNEGYAKLLTQAQVYARHLEDRISELETALEPFALGWVIGDAELKDRTARVLRKGE